MGRPEGSTKVYYSLLPEKLPVWFAYRENYLAYVSALREIRAQLKLRPGDAALRSDEVECLRQRDYNAHRSHNMLSNLRRDWRLTAARYTLTDLEILIHRKLSEVINEMIGNWIDDLRMCSSPTLAEAEAEILLSRIAETRKRLGVPTDVEMPI